MEDQAMAGTLGLVREFYDYLDLPAQRLIQGKIFHHWQLGYRFDDFPIFCLQVDISQAFFIRVWPSKSVK